MDTKPHQDEHTDAHGNGHWFIGSNGDYDGGSYGDGCNSNRLAHTYCPRGACATPGVAGDSRSNS